MCIVNLDANRNVTGEESSALEGVRRLLFAYSEGVDSGRFDEVADLFGDSGLYGEVDGPAARGRDQVLLAMQRNVRLYDGVPRTRHVVTNVVIDLDVDLARARCRSYVQVLHQAPGADIRTIVAGTYHDVVEHVSDTEWRFIERRMHLELLGDLSTHLVHNPFQK